MISSLAEAPWPEPDVLLSVRSGKVKSLGNSGLRSGIHKQPHRGPVQLVDVGVPGDEIDYHRHGGIEKALHQYCAAHYPRWRCEKPDKKHMFDIGSFGENLSCENLDEDNVCIGDTYSIGEDVVVQVTEPRMPCYKLNARFEWPQAARRVQKAHRYGWYLRVLKLGAIQEGDRMSLLTRPNPRWSIRNTMSVLVSTEVHRSLLSELQGIEGLGEYIRDKAGKLAASGADEDSLVRTKGRVFDWKGYTVEDVRMVAPRVRQLTLAHPDSKDRAATDSQMSAHAYVRLRFGPDDNKLERSYSVVSGDMNRFVLGIALDDRSRGGSRYLHERVRAHDLIEVVTGTDSAVATTQKPPSGFDPARDIHRHIFIIGGIGVTAFLRTLASLKDQKAPVEVHYACRSRADAAYQHLLPPEPDTMYYAKDEGRRLDVTALIPDPGSSSNEKHTTAIYACGPTSLMDAVEARCDALAYPRHLLQLESFGALPADGKLGEPFDVVADDLEQPKREVHVPQDVSLLDALNNAGFEVPFSCKAGRCGICVVNVRSGLVVHKGTGLMEEAKGSAMLSCVSRGRGRIEVEIE